MAIESIAKIGQANIDLSPSMVSDITTMTETGGFSSLLMEKLSSVDSHLQRADGLVERYIRGDDVAVHDVLISMGKAKTELQLIVEIRNKLLESYQEITKIQL